MPPFYLLFCMGIACLGCQSQEDQIAMDIPPAEDAVTADAGSLTDDAGVNDSARPDPDMSREPSVLDGSISISDATSLSIDAHVMDMNFNQDLGPVIDGGQMQMDAGFQDLGPSIDGAVMADTGHGGMDAGALDMHSSMDAGSVTDVGQSQGDSGEMDMHPLIDFGPVVDAGQDDDDAASMVEPVETGWHEITQEGRGGKHEWTAALGAIMSPAQPDGRIYRLTLPQAQGPGLSLEQMVPESAGIFHKVTAEQVPSHWGVNASYSVGVFIDMNDDGWSDIALWSDFSLGPAEVFLFIPPANAAVEPGRFEPVDLAGDRVTVSRFFGVPSSRETARRHINAAVVADADQDGDEDIFLARQNVNIILENLSCTRGDEPGDNEGVGPVRCDPWSMAEVWNDDVAPRMIRPRFRTHYLDARFYPEAPAPDDDAEEAGGAYEADGADEAHEAEGAEDVDEVEDAPILSHFSNTMLAGSFEHGGRTYFYASDGVCSGRGGCASFEDDGIAGIRSIHLYGDTGQNTPVIGNGRCELGESRTAADEVDCNGNGVAENNEEISYRFYAIKRWPIPTLNTAAITLVHTGEVNTPHELIFLGRGSQTRAGRLRNMRCFRDPGLDECPDDDTASPSGVLRLPADMNMDTVEWSPLSNAMTPRFSEPDFAHSLDIDSDGVSELILASRATLWEGTPLRIFSRSDDGWLGRPPLNHHQDEDHSIEALLSHDFDADGNPDLMTLRIEGYATAWGGTDAQGPYLSWVRKAPLQSANLKHVTFGDYDQDGDMDGVTKTGADTEQDVAELLFYENSGDGTLRLRRDLFFWRSENDALTPIDPGRVGFDGLVESVDLDGDGDLDLVASQRGALLALENRLCPDGTLRFHDRPEWIPPWYGQGRDAPGQDPVLNVDPCVPWSGDEIENMDNGKTSRCRSWHFTVGDFDQNGRPDIAVVSQKGMNDILFNHIEQTQCGDFPGPDIADDNGPDDLEVHGLPPNRFLSARTDLRIRSVLPVNGGFGSSPSNQARRVFLRMNEPDRGPPDLVVAKSLRNVGTPFATYFSNEIEAPFPRGISCELDADCLDDEVCQEGLGARLTDPVHGYVDHLKVCIPENGGPQRIQNGWFRIRPNVFDGQPLDEVDETANRVLGCSASGDVNGDGYDDLLLSSAVGDAVPNLAGEWTVGARCPAMRADGSGGYESACAVDEVPDPANEMDEDGAAEADPNDARPALDQGECSMIYECTPGTCPQEWNPEDPHDWEQQCCAEIRPDSERMCPDRFLPKPDCFRDTCEIKGNRELSFPRQTRLFLYVWNPESDAYEKYVDPLDTRAFPGATILDCKIADLDGDGRGELIVGGYLTSDLPEAFAHRPLPLLTNEFTHELRRSKTALVTSIWTHPDDLPAQGPLRFQRVDFPRISDKIYHLMVVDLDGQDPPEIVTTGANTLTIFGYGPLPVQP